MQEIFAFFCRNKISTGLKQIFVGWVFITGLFIIWKKGRDEMNEGMILRVVWEWRVYKDEEEKKSEFFWETSFSKFLKIGGEELC